MERIQDVSKLVYTHVQGGQFRWVTVSTLMLALGTILHLVSPSVAGVTPNWTIATYCVAIHLTRPNYRQALGIGLVAALINVMTSKSAFPYGNLISEPAGALTCAILVSALSRIKLGRMSLQPALSGFLATVVSGGAFVTLLFFVLKLPLNVYLKVMWPMVLMVGLCNAVVTPLLYIPAQRLFARRGYLPENGVLTGDHSQYILEPKTPGKVVLEHFTYYYGNAKKPALKDINLVVNDGDFLVITGPAGCGKSTLSLAMTGAVPKFYGGRMEGMVFVNGQATTQHEIASLATDIGIVMADYDTQLVTMTVGEEVAFAMENRGYSPKDIKERSAVVFKQVGLEGMEARKISSLSGGQRQRLAIASVLATNPSILVLDEPTSSMDPEGTDELYRLVGALNKDYGITVIVIDHDLNAVMPYANRVALLVDGELKSDDVPAVTLEYMYKHNIYTDTLPTVFTAYMKLRDAGFNFTSPWLSVAAAKTDLKTLGKAQ